MSTALVATVALLGLAGSPHCAAMCGAPCAALARRCGGARPHEALAGHQLGRIASYALAGAVVATGAGWLVDAARAAAWLRPVWLMLPLSALALGLWLLVAGRPLRRASDVAPPPATTPVRGPAPIGRVRGVASATGAGLLWAAWPCGLLYSALLVAALADGPAGGAAVMTVFALASMPGLLTGPLLWARFGQRAAASHVLLRSAGGLLSAASAWGLWLQFSRPDGLWCIRA